MEFRRVECIGEGLTGLSTSKFEDGWKLTLVKEYGHGNHDISDIDASVPGNVRMALVDRGIISDPFIGKNNEGSKWVSDATWKYTNILRIVDFKEKILSKYPDGGFLHIVFDGIDYDASFSIEDQFITRQTGMFSPVDIICGISRHSNAQENKDIPIKLHFHRQPSWRTHAVKCQMAFGWDFAPEIRTIGIWNHVRTHITGPLFFTRLYPQVLQTNSNDPGIVDVKILFCIGAFDPIGIKEKSGSQDIELDIMVGDIDLRKRLKVQSGVETEIVVEDVALSRWWPHTMGRQPILPLKIRLIQNGAITDEYRGTIANRSIRWQKNPGTWPKNENWTIKVNNESLFLKGMNWVPPDSLFGRISEEKYHSLIDSCIELNIDMLRVWGGGIEEKTSFYNYCDNRGVMIWQEFPFACTNYPKFPEYIPIANKECISIAKRTRRHPSVVVYCGGNEFNPFINDHIIDIVKSAVSDYAPDRYCFASSPYLGDDHNWRVWGMGRGFEAYEANRTGIFQMLTEYGYQAAPAMSTLKQCVNFDKLESKHNSAGEIPIRDIEDYLSYHKADINNHRHYSKKHGKEIRNLNDLLKISQNLQAYALKTAIEICRSSWPNVSGVFPWQLSDPWPNISWSLLDYNLEPKLAFKMVKKSYSPVLPMVRNWKGYKWNSRLLHGDIIIHNSTQRSFKGYLDVIESNQRDKNPKFLFKDQSIHVNPDVPLKLGELQTKSERGNKIVLRLHDADKKLIMKNFHFPSMEPVQTRLGFIREWIDARFDGWWRIHMTKLMELERLREENELWNQMN